MHLEVECGSASCLQDIGRKEWMSTSEVFRFKIESLWSCGSLHAVECHPLIARPSHAIIDDLIAKRLWPSKNGDCALVGDTGIEPVTPAV